MFVLISNLCNQGDLALNSGNYDLSYQGNNLTITKALLNVIADAKTKGSLSRVAGENVGVYGINQGGLGLVSGNYDLAYQGNNLTITNEASLKPCRRHSSFTGTPAHRHTGLRLLEEVENLLFGKTLFHRRSH